jgi:hypothetical protein
MNEVIERDCAFLLIARRCPVRVKDEGILGAAI